MVDYSEITGSAAFHRVTQLSSVGSVSCRSEGMGIVPRIRIGARGIETKILLKNLLRPKFTPDFVDPRKMGFGIPLAAAFHGSLKELVKDLLLGDHGAMVSFVDGAAVRALVRDYYTGHPDLWSRLWAVLCLRLWFKIRQSKMLDRSA